MKSQGWYKITADQGTVKGLIRKRMGVIPTLWSTNLGWKKKESAKTSGVWGQFASSI